MASSNHIKSLWQTLERPGRGQTFSEGLVQGLPEAAQRYLRHSIRPGTPLAATASITMSGSIKPGPGMPWLPFAAQEVISPWEGFAWRARAGWGPVLLSAEDYYFAGEAATRVSLLGMIRMVNAAEPDVSKAALGRLVSEAIFIPSVFLSEQVAW